MKVLLSNDDGYQAVGLETLYRELCEFADVTVVAPDRDRSGASNSLTLESPCKLLDIRSADRVGPSSGLDVDDFTLALPAVQRRDLHQPGCVSSVRSKLAG